jgi:SAM-dependent methyltransferase
VKLTGERPLHGSTPDSLLALHDAGYREVAARLGPGVVLDIGCGTGHATDRLGAPGRVVIGVDYDTPTAVGAAEEWRASRPDMRFAAMDGARLGLADESTDWVCSSHVIEHFTAPEQHAAEVARVLRPDGTAFVLTPNKPADFANPFHVYLFEAPELASLLGLFFTDVEVLALEGSDALHADFAARRSSGERILALDVFDLRKRIPQSWYVWGYERLLPLVYRVLGSEKTGIGSGIDERDLFIGDKIEPTTPVLLAVARGPRRGRREHAAPPRSGQDREHRPRVRAVTE